MTDQISIKNEEENITVTDTDRGASKGKTRFFLSMKSTFIFDEPTIHRININDIPYEENEEDENHLELSEETKKALKEADTESDDQLISHNDIKKKFGIDD